ncbi:MAG: SDR family oxidoreductase [Solirubrobacteraceae bacterium]|nr:SDR family oxidoreductase [Solirubrobacteraceae bacterium]
MLSLLTGFPGFIGTRLSRKLLADDPDTTIVAIVEPKMAARAREVAAELDGRLTVVVGDITDPKLGFSDTQYADLAATVRRVYHLAAIYDLAVPEDIARKVNVDGTKHVIDFCRAAKDLERHHYVSTCYVAGKRKGKVLESELDEGQEFKNHYESTKFAAETLVRASMPDVPTTVYRPGIVVGDSRTGDTQKFDGPYFILWFIHRMKQLGLTVGSMGTDSATFNAVPVDFIVDAMAACTQDPQTVGATLALADPNPLTTRQFVSLLSRTFVQREPFGPKIPDFVMKPFLAVKPVRKFYGGTPFQSLVFLHHPVQYDTTEATRHLARSGLKCPGFHEYVPVMVDFFQKNKGNKAFQAKA